ncbi:MAG: cytochrome c4 [Gammaproteobacteria bacterium]|nr:cytochrome c4 [Gammaproteobacteria bacterium]NNJ71604.1 cytochrome c4 [Enterobacterales bacterium]
MKQLVLVIFLTVITSAIQAGDATAGKNKSMVCSTCHGSEGISMAGNWPNLAGQHEKYLAKQLSEYKSGKRNNAQMSAMAMPLSEEDIADLSAYYASLEADLGEVKENFLALGKEIYERGAEGVMACTACHGPNGKGVAAAGFPYLSGQKVEYTITTLKEFRAGIRNNDMNGMMRDIAKAMSDEQIEAVANYLLGLH